MSAFSLADVGWPSSNLRMVVGFYPDSARLTFVIVLVFCHIKKNILVYGAENANKIDK